MSYSFRYSPSLYFAYREFEDGSVVRHDREGVFGWKANRPKNRRTYFSIPGGSCIHFEYRSRHWSNRTEAFKEIKRVTTQRFVAVTWNPASKPYWLSADYFPEIHHVDQAIFPSLQELAIAFPGMKFHSLPIPSDCIDGFTAAYWAKPEAYLDPIARQSMSTFTKIGNVESGLSKLESDLKSGIWENRYAEVTGLMELDVGYKVAVWDAPNVVLKLRDESTSGCAKTPWPGATTGVSTRSPCAAGP